MALAMVLRSAMQEDLPQLLAIENESFPGPGWTAQHFAQYDCTVAIDHDAVAGFLVVRQVFKGSGDAPSEWEILNLAVASPFRRQGVATLLLRGQIELGGEQFLEVRESNLPARNLYRKLGFNEISMRKDYYRNPDESGIVMRLK